MALTFIKRSSIPIAVKGKVATEPTVTITDAGQIRLNSLSTKFLNGNNKAAIGYDADKKKLYIIRADAKLASKLDEKELFTFGHGKKDTNLYVSGAGLLRGETKYDFATSGNQVFKSTLDDKNGCIVIDLPEGALAKKPTTPRKRKAKVAVGTVANPGSTVGTPTAPVVEELVLAD